MTDEDTSHRLVEQVKHCEGVPESRYPEPTWGGREDLIEPLVEVLGSLDESNGRSNAAEALGYIGGERAIEPLCERIRDDPSPTVRTAAIWAVRCLGSPEAVSTLQDVVRNDSDGDVRWQAARALAVVEWEDKPAYAEYLLRNGGERSWEGFRRELGHDHVTDHDAVSKRLDNLDEETLSDEQLARLLRALGEFDTVTNRITAYLDHPEAQIRAAAADGIRGHENAPLDRLLSLGREDPDPDVRGKAVDAFGFTVDETAPLSKLTQFVEDDAATVREAAVHQLRSADPPNNAPVLVEALHDPAAAVRARAARSLKVVSFPGTVPELLDAYPDEDGTVRENIVCALQWIEGDSGRTDASTFSMLEDSTVPTVDGSDTRPYEPAQAVDVLTAALHDTEQSVSEEAAYTLARTDHRDAARVLAEFVTDTDIPPDRRANGVRYLRHLQSFQETTRAYQTALNDDDPAVRSAAVGIADRMNDVDTTQALGDALRDSSPEVRKTGAEAASRHDAERVDETLRNRLDTETDDNVVCAIRKALDGF